LQPACRSVRQQMYVFVSGGKEDEAGVTGLLYELLCEQ